jgi:hypothetical protein
MTMFMFTHGVLLVVVWMLLLVFGVVVLKALIVIQYDIQKKKKTDCVRRSTCEQFPLYLFI